MQILIWMESRRSFQATAADHAAKLDLMIKVNSIANAEQYFEKLSSRASLKAASLPLLHSYVRKRELEKAEALLAKLQDRCLIVDPHPFNEIMKLYVAMGHFDKVIYVIRHMKQSNVPLNVLSYNLWLNACGELSEIYSLNVVYEEMVGVDGVEVGWSTYCTLANVYTRFGHVDEAFAALKIAESKLSSRKRLGYSFVMTNYAALGDKDGVMRLWECSKRVKGKMPCANYMSVISCLVKLGEVFDAERVFEEWESQCGKYDIRVPNILLGAYTRNGCIEKAEFMFYDALKKGALPNYKTWEILMEGWVRSKQMEKAMEAMKKCLDLMKGCVWKPSSEILSVIAGYYEEVGNVDGGRRFVSDLQRFGLMNLQLYKSFVRMHMKAECTAPNVLQMMGCDGIEPDDEIGLLIRQADSIVGVCVE